MKRILVFTLVFGFLCASVNASAQKFSIQTNLLDWATLCTVNMEGSVSLAQHFSVHAGFRYNPWTFEKNNGAGLKMQQSTFYAGFRYWTWYVHSGLWFAAKAQVQNFQLGGFRIPGIIEEEGVKGTGGFGPGLAVGYTFMLNDSINLEVGAGGWVPYYKDLGLRLFPDFLSLSLVYVF